MADYGQAPALTLQRDATLAMNQYQRGLGQLRFPRQQADFGRRMDEQQRTLPYDFTARGFGRSGIAQRAMRNFAADRTSQQSELQLTQNDYMARLNMSDDTAKRALEAALLQIALNRQALSQGNTVTSVGAY